MPTLFDLSPLLALGQTVAEADAVPGWLPVVAAILATFSTILVKLWPIIEGWSSALKNSKVDNLIVDIVGDLSATSAKDIHDKIADKTLTKEEGRQLLIALGENAVKEILEEVGEHYLGKNTERLVKRKLERVVEAEKRSSTLVEGVSGN